MCDNRALDEGFCLLIFCVGVTLCVLMCDESVTSGTPDFLCTFLPCLSYSRAYMAKPSLTTKGGCQEKAVVILCYSNETSVMNFTNLNSELLYNYFSYKSRY